MLWSTFKGWFNHSVTILGARLTALSGAVLSYLTIIQGVDLSAVIAPKYYPFFVIGLGFLFETLRRRTVNSATNSSNQIVTAKGKIKK